MREKNREKKIMGENPNGKEYVDKFLFIDHEILRKFTYVGEKISIVMSR